jgi:hypothetical protein
MGPNNPNPPTFFFSHARQDREAPGGYLRAFFRDLEYKLAEWAGVDLRATRLGTIDARVQQGDNWDAALSAALQTNKTFVAIITPLYFNRINCGKEAGVFLLRSPNLGIDVNGALTGVSNVMLIRWLPESAYSVNAGNESLIPKILRLIEDTPADAGDDDDRTKAIERYRRKGMEKCVNVEPHYGELLDLFAARIRDMGGLPPAANADFNAAVDAFRHDWRTSFPGSPVAAAAPPAANNGERPAPQPLSSVVAFYLTARPLLYDAAPIDFADRLVAEPTPDRPAAGAADADFTQLLADVRKAGLDEGMTVLPVAPNVEALESAEPLAGQLAKLTATHVITVLVVDPALLEGPTTGEVIGQLARLEDWPGSILIPETNISSTRIAALIAQKRLESKAVIVAGDSSTRILTISQAMVAVRSRVLRSSTTKLPDAQPLPVLKGVTSKVG